MASTQFYSPEAPQESEGLSPSQYTTSSDDGEPYDLIGIGFGPANLAIAIALVEAVEEEWARGGSTTRRPRVLFLEKQTSFGWHEGMLLPGTKMQISFVKDLATLRNPRSRFTFLNYLKDQNRLVQFSNLDTFLPARKEFQDYLSWCASHFRGMVRYGREVASIRPVLAKKGSKLAAFDIDARDASNGSLSTLRTRHVVISTGGRPRIPESLSIRDERIIHSSQYAHSIGAALPDQSKPYRVLVLGGGQSAAEIFNDLASRYPNSRTTLLIRDTSLRPSDDSPFVNEVFDPERVDSFYDTPQTDRVQSLQRDRLTNYGVVRLGLLNTLYERFYAQRMTQPDERRWQHRMVTSSQVVGMSRASEGGFVVEYEKVSAARGSGVKVERQRLEVDAIVYATGYIRDVHERMLEPCRPFFEGQETARRCVVARDYSVILKKDRVAGDAGVWLQGCNEQTHGLSDSLLSILSIRGGEMVRNIFKDWYPASQRQARL